MQTVIIRQRSLDAVVTCLACLALLQTGQAYSAVWKLQLLFLVRLCLHHICSLTTASFFTEVALSSDFLLGVLAGIFVCERSIENYRLLIQFVSMFECFLLPSYIQFFVRQTSV